MPRGLNNEDLRIIPKFFGEIKNIHGPVSMSYDIRKHSVCKQYILLQKIFC